MGDSEFIVSEDAYSSDVRLAMKNARDEVKAAADFICKSRDEDGVVKWIENHI